MFDVDASSKRSHIRRWATLLGVIGFVVAYVLCAGGCDSGNTQLTRETDEPHFRRAQSELKQGHTKEAMAAFMRVVDKRRDAPESHLELGRLYLDEINDPIQAIYHFKRYLELNPDSRASTMVRQMIETAQKKFMSTLPGNPFDSNIRKVELEELVVKLQAENLELKQKLAQSQSRADTLQQTQRVNVVRATAPAGTVVNQPVATQPASTSQQASAPRTEAVRADAPSSYTVQVGDTLSSISRKVYGTSNRWKDIFAANRDRLSSPEAVKPGQTLRIPR